MFIKAKAACLLLMAIFATGSLQAQSVVRGPYLQMQTDDGLTIHWRTDTATESVVRYGTSQGSLINTASVTGSRTEHAVELSGLGSAQKFWYSVGNDSGPLAGDDTYHFNTAPAQGIAADTRIWVIGDSGTANANAAAVRDAYKTWSASNPADLWLMLGDNAYNDGTDAEYQAAVFNTYPEILRQLPLWATLGNHDGRNADSATQTGPYYDIFNLPANAEIGGLASFTEAYYSFDYANIHFVCLDSYDTSRATNGAMLTWLESDLASHTQPWVIAFWHHPPYTKGSHNSDTEGALIDMRQNALPILEAWGVDLVMTGHSHSYERSYLLDGHYGPSTSLDPVANVLDPGNGRQSGDGVYEKPDIIAAEHAGAVYAVAGSSGKTSGGTLDHPAMLVNLNSLGSLVLDVSGNRLDVVFIDQTGAEKDEFSVVKTPDFDPPLISGAAAEDASHVIVNFNEPLDSLEASDSSNYSIAGLTVSQAELMTGDRSVRLTTSAMTDGSSYTLVVNNLRDLAGNTILPDSEIDFDFYQVMTLTFQNGLSPTTAYDGTADAYIREASPSTAHGLETSLQVDGDEPSGTATDMNILLQWDISSIPADSIVEAAQFQLEVSNISAGSYNCYSLLADWEQSQVTWNQASTGVAWGTPGAESAADRGSQTLCTVNAGTTGPLVVSLNSEGLALVQSWITSSANNHGIIITHPSTSDGADFHSSESATAMARPKLEVTYRVATTPGNNDPAASFTFDCTALNCNFTDTSSDSDGSIASWLWDFGDGGFSTARDPAHSYTTAGSYTVSLTVDDDDGAMDTSSANVVVSVPPGHIDQLAEADLPSAGSVSGSYLDTHADGGAVQSITERQSGGKKNSRYSYLSHSWRFTVAPGSSVTLHAHAWSGGSTEGDSFTFAWSTDNVNFDDLFILSGTSPGTPLTAEVPASGTVYIRVTDNDRTARRTVLDTIFVDQLYIRTGDATPVDPPERPTDLSVSPLSSNSLSLSWVSGSNDETGFELQRRPVTGGAWQDVATPGGGSTTYVDGGLAASTGYEYQICATNSGGESAWSEPASGTTMAAPDISLSASGYKVKGRHFIDLSWSGASSGSVDIRRDNVVSETYTGNSGSDTDEAGNKGARTYVYKACEEGTNTCSDEVVVVF